MLHKDNGVSSRSWRASRDDLLFLLGGPRIDHKARETWLRRRLWPGHRPSQVASYVLQECFPAKAYCTTDAIAKLAEKH